jgi:single-strand DNA-binding protein
MLKAFVIGNLGKDAVVNNVGNKTVINFSVAHTEKFKDAQGNSKDKTIWVECAYWTDRTGIAPYLKKGTQVYVEGNPDVKTFTKQDGTTGTNLTLRVLSVQLLGGGSNSNTAPQAQQTNATYGAAPKGTDNRGFEPIDDLPF